MFTDKEKEFLKEKCKLEPYQIGTIERAQDLFDFSDKIVLEIGGSNLPKECVFDIMGAKKWVCIDLIAPYQVLRNKEHYNNCTFINLNDAELFNKIMENDYVIIKGDIADVGESLRESFDICLSLCCFEHIHRFNMALSNIYCSLKENGILFTEFGPIYSCKYGSHYWYDINSNFNRQEAILDYKHLLMDNMELLIFLLENFPQEKANMIHHHFKYSERINRLFYEDYIRYMELSDFANYKLKALKRIEVGEELQDQLMKKYPGYKDFSTYSIQILAWKNKIQNKRRKKDITRNETVN